MKQLIRINLLNSIISASDFYQTRDYQIICLPLKEELNFYHCDPAGILFYARLFEICHSVYEEMISGFNLEDNYWQNDDYVVPIVKCDAGFYKPVKPGEEVTIELASD